MSVVSSSVTTMRQQIVEGAKFSLATACNFLLISDSWGLHTDSTKYPLAKCYIGTSTLYAEYLGKKDIREDEFILTVAPWCSAIDFETETSKIIESFAPLLNTASVRACMYPSYGDRLEKITFSQAEMMNTDLNNPYAFVKFTYKVRYSIST